MAVVCLQALGDLRYAAANFNFGGTRDDFGAVCTFEASRRVKRPSAEWQIEDGIGQAIAPWP